MELCLGYSSPNHTEAKMRPRLFVSLEPSVNTIKSILLLASFTATQKKFISRLTCVLEKLIGRLATNDGELVLQRNSAIRRVYRIYCF